MFNGIIKHTGKIYNIYKHNSNCIMEISSKRLGATAVLQNQEIVGIITDGDLRRMLEKGKKIEEVLAKDIMNKKIQKALYFGIYDE